MNLITHRMGTVSVVRDWFAPFPSSPVLISAGVSSNVTALLLYTCTHTGRQIATTCHITFIEG